MKQITEKIEELKEIHVEKMHFRVISRHPQYSIDTANRIFEEKRKGGMCYVSNRCFIRKTVTG